MNFELLSCSQTPNFIIPKHSSGKPSPKIAAKIMPKYLSLSSSGKKNLNYPNAMKIIMGIKSTKIFFLNKWNLFSFDNATLSKPVLTSTICVTSNFSTKIFSYPVYLSIFLISHTVPLGSGQCILKTLLSSEFQEGNPRATLHT